MSEQEEKRQRIYDLLNSKNKLKFLCLPYTKQRNFFFLTKSFQGKREAEDRTKREKKAF